jgi:hypothetical protein
MYNEEAHCEVVIERACNIIWPRDRIIIQVRRLHAQQTLAHGHMMFFHPCLQDSEVQWIRTSVGLQLIRPSHMHTCKLVDGPATALLLLVLLVLLRRRAMIPHVRM